MVCGQMIDISILPMKPEHVSEVAQIEKLCFSDPWSENSIAGELNNQFSLWLVAIYEGRVVGYIGSQSAVDEADMMNLAVLPEYRSHKIGTMLVETLEKQLREQGSYALFLEVRESNLPAISLYEKLGFCAVGVRPNYYFHPKENAIIMRKELVDHENPCN